MSVDELRAACCRKAVQDDDDRHLRLLKEVYLENGDLTSDGAGRKRSFRWQNLDDIEASGGLELSDTDEPPDDVSEQQWRQSRHQREHFLQQTIVSQVLTLPNLHHHPSPPPCSLSSLCEFAKSSNVMFVYVCHITTVNYVTNLTAHGV